ncbi:DUF4249 family protein [Polluticoccus soli]|uniref:DUF4249 family protein n=1 Tax=Polluticoccus soli TaxID=3034150 RepID=UPI0023E2D761|nr:DUF4249 family protein [Flavipsychrobacter sp. JY13-12]
MLKLIFNSNAFKFSGIAVVLFIVTLLVSCEKDVDIKLQDGQARLVVEGSIETGQPPFILLTKSIGYFAKIDLTTLQNSFVHGAEVTLSDGNRTVKLREYSFDTSGLGNKFSFYSIDTSSLDNFMIGEVEKYYTLTIKFEGQTYTSTTKIPSPTRLDSVISAIPPFIPENNPDVRFIKVFFKEPDTAGNFVRYFTSRNGQRFYPGLNSVYTDEFINGTYFETPLSGGEDRNSTVGRDSLGFFYPGDTVVLKWAAIDKKVYEFYNTFEYAIGTLGSPFATPISVKSNISNGALGVWAGYGTYLDTVVIK